jgi:hypothetical protein
MTLPRGYRNNNPGNLRISKSLWLGKVPLEDNTDGAFEQFISMEYGLRAMMKLLIKYITKYGDEDVVAIVDRYAPSEENDTDNYVNTIIKYTGFGPYDDLKPDKETIIKLVNAMCIQENGINKISQETLEKAWDMI